MRRRTWLPAALAVLALAGAACSSDAEAPPTSAGEAGIATTLTDFKIKAAETEAPVGTVTLDLANDGPSDHSFFLVKTDLADDALPVADHLVQVDGLEVVAQIDKFDEGTEQSLTVDLEAGDYVMFCNLTGHYESDMHATFTVA